MYNTLLQQFHKWHVTFNGYNTCYNNVTNDLLQGRFTVLFTTFLSRNDKLYHVFTVQIPHCYNNGTNRIYCECSQYTYNNVTHYMLQLMFTANSWNNVTHYMLQLMFTTNSYNNVTHYMLQLMFTTNSYNNVTHYMLQLMFTTNSYNNVTHYMLQLMFTMNSYNNVTHYMLQLMFTTNSYKNVTINVYYE